MSHPIRIRAVYRQPFDVERFVAALFEQALAQVLAEDARQLKTSVEPTPPVVAPAQEEVAHG